MVPGEYSLPRTGTISGRACAAFVARRPAPMVTASVTAIRFDIDLLRFARPAKDGRFARTGQKGLPGPRIFNRAR
jgi:hypothetical protein